MHAFSFLRRRVSHRIRRSACREGQTLVEYALILALVALVALSAFSALGNRVIYIFSSITSLLDSAQSP